MRNPVVLITGGAGGIGAATARRLHDEGARVAIVDRDTTAGPRVAKEVDGLFIAADVGDLHENRRAVAAVVDAYSRLDVVVLALIGLVRSAAPALAAHDVRINALCPALVDTPAISRIRASLTEHGIPLARPDEVAAAMAAVIADPRTGQVWTVHPGRPAVLLPPPTNAP